MHTHNRFMFVSASNCSLVELFQKIVVDVCIKPTNKYNKWEDLDVKQTKKKC